MRRNPKLSIFPLNLAEILKKICASFSISIYILCVRPILLPQVSLFFYFCLLRLLSAKPGFLFFVLVIGCFIPKFSELGLQIYSNSSLHCFFFLLL